MPHRRSLLAQGIAAAKAGDKSNARRLLTRAVRRNPDSEAAWLWLSAVLDTPQGRAFCLRKVLALNPANESARHGLSILDKASPAPVLVTQPLREPLERPLRTTPLVAPSSAARQQRFWQIIVAGLAVIALGLVSVLAYATLNGSSANRQDTLAAISSASTPELRAALRPTFTATPTKTPTPTDTVTPTPTDTPIPTHTPTPTDTSTPTPTSTSTSMPTAVPRRSEKRAATATPTASPLPYPTLPPRVWDPRLDALGVRIEPAPVGPGQPYWRLVEARWSNEPESAGKHSIFIEVLDLHGVRAVGQPVVVQWTGSNVILTVEDPPPPDWGTNFPMYNTLGSYAVKVGGVPSDRVVGMGLGTVETPDFKVHTCFYLTFRRVQ